MDPSTQFAEYVDKSINIDIDRHVCAVNVSVNEYTLICLPRKLSAGTGHF